MKKLLFILAAVVLFSCNKENSNTIGWIKSNDGIICNTEPQIEYRDSVFIIDVFNITKLSVDSTSVLFEEINAKTSIKDGFINEYIKRRLVGGSDVLIEIVDDVETIHLIIPTNNFK